LRRLVPTRAAPRCRFGEAIPAPVSCPLFFGCILPSPPSRLFCLDVETWPLVETSFSKPLFGRMDRSGSFHFRVAQTRAKCAFSPSLTTCRTSVAVLVPGPELSYMPLFSHVGPPPPIQGCVAILFPRPSPPSAASSLSFTPFLS